MSDENMGPPGNPGNVLQFLALVENEVKIRFTKVDADVRQDIEDSEVREELLVVIDQFRRAYDPGAPMDQEVWKFQGDKFRPRPKREGALLPVSEILEHRELAAEAKAENERKSAHGNLYQQALERSRAHSRAMGIPVLPPHFTDYLIVAAAIYTTSATHGEEFAPWETCFAQAKDWVHRALKQENER